MNIGKFQIINRFPKWKVFKFKKTNPAKDTNASYYLIYRWFVLIGSWEIRKFMNDQQRKDAIELHRKRKIKTK